MRVCRRGSDGHVRRTRMTFIVQDNHVLLSSRSSVFLLDDFPLHERSNITAEGRFLLFTEVGQRVYVLFAVCNVCEREIILNTVIFEQEEQSGRMRKC